MNKILVLIWKNYLVLKFHWVQTLLEILLPVLMFSLLATSQEENGGLDDIPGMQATDLSDWTPAYNKSGDVDDLTYQFFYTPNTAFSTAMMHNLRRYITLLTNDELKIIIEPVANNKELETRYSTVSAQKKKNMFGLIFNDEVGHGGQQGVPPRLTYTMRINDSLGEVDKRDFPMAKPTYGIFFIKSGLQFLQTTIDLIYIGFLNGRIKLNAEANTIETYKNWVLENHYNISVFPYSPYKAERPTVGQERMSGMFSLILIYSIFMICTSIMHGVVGDKQSGITELMKLMGLNRTLIWLGWLIRNLMLYSFTVSIIVLIMKTKIPGSGMTLEHSNPVLVWVFIMQFIVAQTCFLFLISTFVAQPMVAVGCAVFAWVGSETMAVQLRPELPFELKMTLSLLPNVAARFGALAIGRLEQKQRGAQWDNLFEHGSETDVTLGSVMYMFIINTILNAVFTWYLEAINPGPFGIPKVWYFPIKHKTTWDLRPTGSVPLLANLPENFEPPSAALRTSIEIVDLRKVYDNGGVVAVDGVTIDIYENQITALLGHNGAGKTTTMSIITGMCPATSGSVKIYGQDIRHGMRAIRKSMGLCPQHDLFFGNLTALQHLMFFGMIKGLSYREAKRRSLDLLQDFSMRDSKDMLCEPLSGGLRRKLSLAIALIGNPRVIVLDEPTSGLDPAARRQVWDMLLRLRGSKTIIITTHIMEEADVLGDRTAIMHHGQVQCYGTPLYLKKRYGGGFRLAVITPRPVEEQLTRLVEKAVPGATFLGNLGAAILAGIGRVGAELGFSLPENKKSFFPAMFEELEKNKVAMNITSIGLALTTIEDVFLKVGGIADTATPRSSVQDRPENWQPYENEHNMVLLGLQRLYGLTVKKWICILRKWRFFMLMTGLLAVAMIATVYTTLNTSETRSVGVIDVTLNHYRGRLVTLQTSSDAGSVQLAKSYVEVVTAHHSWPHEVPPTKDLLVDFLSISEATLNNYSDKIVAGAIISPNNTAIFFNAVPQYALPVSVNIMDNAILHNQPNQIGAKSWIQTNISPLRASKENTRLDIATAVLFWAILFPIVVLCLMGGFIGYPLTDRASGARRVQLMTGASWLSYWISCFLIDLVIYMLVCTLFLSAIPFFDDRGYYNTLHEMSALAVIFLLYGFSMIPYAYCLSLTTDNEGQGFTLLILINITITTLVPMILAIMRRAKAQPVKDVVNVITNVLHLAPHYCLVKALESFAKIALINNFCSTLLPDFLANLCKQNQYSECCVEDRPLIDHYKFVFEYDTMELGYGKVLAAMIVDGVLYTVILLVRESDVLSLLLSLLAGLFCPISTAKDDINEEVLEEMMHIATPGFNSNGEYLMVADNLVKRYGLRRTATVKGVSFTVRTAQCFGLLGTNGAGKTTTFKVLTGTLRVTSGVSYIAGNTLRSSRAAYLADLGYCPQDNAFNDLLTAKQMLNLYARLRGIPGRHIASAVDELVRMVGLSGYENFQSGTYSGGNKRKLMIAIALIGEPKIVFLDEPSSGVDPGARRKIWKVLSRVQNTGKSLVMTSHSMDECEALCDELAIMVDGRFVAIGTIPYLKNRYGQGFTVQLKVSVTDMDAVKTEFIAKFAPCTLKDEHSGFLHFHLRNPAITWSYLFSNMEKLKDKMHGLLEDYVIAGTTLEEVFLAFAKKEEQM